MSVAAKASAFTVLALLSGVGIVYAPMLSFAAVAAVFAAGLWLLTGGGRPPRAAIRRWVLPHSTLTTKLVSGFLLLWWLALIAPMLAYSQRDVTDAAATSSGGSLLNQALLASFGLVGALFLPAAVRRFDSAFRWVLTLWILNLCWIFASLLWSVYPALTFRNAVAFALVSVGSFGLGAGFYGNRPDGRSLLLRHVFVAGLLSALVILVPLPFRWGAYDLLDPSQRLEIGGGFPVFVVRPVLCALMVFLAATVLRLRTWRIHDWLWLAVLVAPLLVLKSRGPVLYAVLALTFFYLLYRSRVQDRVLQAGLFLVLGVGAYASYSLGTYAPLVPYLTRGSVETTATLTGRIPLWNLLIPQIAEQPWLGYGFAAYWNPQMLASMEQSAGFPVVSAHNGFLDVLLGAGAVGLAVTLAFWVCAAVVAVGRARRGDPVGWLVSLFITFYVLHNLTVSVFTEFLEVPLIVILAMLGLMASKKSPTKPPVARRPPGKTPAGKRVVSLN